MGVDTIEADYEIRNSKRNKLYKSDREFHDWYRFVLSFPPHLVRKYIEEFGLTPSDLILDPFCGTGTTLVEAKLRGIPSIGIEANNFAHFASSVKVDWNVDAVALMKLAEKIKINVAKKFKQQGISENDGQLLELGIELRKLNIDQEKIILKDSISPLPLHKSFILLDEINKYKKTVFHKYLALAMGNSLVYEISNLRFGPEVGVGKIKSNAVVLETWFNQIGKICNDLMIACDKGNVESRAIFSDSRNLKYLLKGEKVSAVITSPPYPNEKDYTRTTRLESVMLGFINNKEELRTLKRSLLRSNTRGIYKGDSDDDYVKGYPEIQRIAEEIEKKRIDLGKTSGFERLYHKVAKLYFGGIAKHLIELQSILKPNAQLAYVVGDQASYLKVMIPTGNLIAEIAESLGYELVKIDLFRTRFSTATKMQLNEEVVVLRWKG
jgi:DNA modification methylase